MKYRVIKKTNVDRTYNTNAIFDFVPEIVFITTYELQFKLHLFSSWQTKYVCKSLEAAKVLFEVETTPTIIKKIL